MKGGELNCKAQHTNTVRTMGVRVHTDLLCLRHGGQLMELESDSWGVFGWCRCQSKLKTRSVAKNSRERVGKRKLWCAQNWDLPMGAFGGVYPVVDGATTGLCMPVQSYGSTSCALDSAVKAQYEGPGRAFRLLASAELDDWASHVPEWVRRRFGSGCWLWLYGGSDAHILCASSQASSAASRQELPLI